MLRLTEGESLRLASRVGGALIIGISVLLATCGTASAASAEPASVAFGDVPINTTATRDVSITVDAGYRTQLASGSGINAPFSFDFDTCGAGGGFAGPGTCNVKQRFSPTARRRRRGRRTCSSARSRAAAVSRSPTRVSGTGREPAAASPSSVRFGDVPINTTATRDVSITVDAGYRTQLASGSGINAPFSFDFDTCGAGGGFAGPGTCNVKQRFSPDGGDGVVGDDERVRVPGRGRQLHRDPLHASPGPG